jgi:hypothetical protein
MLDNQKLRGMREAVVAIGYHVPNENPQWLGTGFLVEDGSGLITCAHVVGVGRGPYFGSIRQKIKIKNKEGELLCWLFKYIAPNIHMIKFPIVSVTIFNKLDINSSYFGEIPDVAYLKINNSPWTEQFSSEPLPVLEISREITRNIGTEVIVIGYPSTTLLLYSQPPLKFNCLEPLTQFCRLSGVLPFENCPLPHFLAFDTIFAKGSSGSPICSAESGQVIAMVSELHPFRSPTINNDGDLIGYTDVPSSIGFGVPSNFFYGMAKSGEGNERFEI